MKTLEKSNGPAGVGKPVTRADGRPKVTGEIRYTADLLLPGMIWGKCLRSPFPHARIVRLDVTEAKRVRGVVTALAAADIPEKLIGRSMKDIPVLARGKVRFVGEKVAVVAAETPDIAEEALGRVVVEYEELDAVYDPLVAMASGAPIIHENIENYENVWRPLPDLANVHSHAQWRLGDAEKAFAECDRTFEQTFCSQRVHHGYLEPHAVVVAIDSSERILIWSPAKGPYITRQQLAEWLGVDGTKITFQLCPIGGDFGGKGSLMDIPICYYLAKTTGRPVKMVMTYFEELTAANPRHPSVITIRTGVKDGKLFSREVKAVFNSGAYAGFKNSEMVNLPGARHGAGAYSIPNVRIDAFSVYTNCVPSGIMRAPGGPQMSFAVECHMDYIAKQLGMDPWDFRRVNVSSCGDSMASGLSVQNGLGGVLLDGLSRKLKTIPKPKKPYTGRGLALCAREINIGEANVEVGIKRDGRVYILTTVPDTGTGAHTIFRQLVSETLGLPASEIEVTLGTTDTFPTDVAVAASRITYVGGQAVHKGALILRERLIEMAANLLGCSPPSVHLSGAFIRGPNGKNVTFAELAAKAAVEGEALRGSGNFTVKERSGVSCFFAQASDVEINPETGKVKILRMISAHDVGTIINPVTHQGQIEGGMVQGLGFALLENLIDEDGRITTADLGSYRIPSICDVPAHQCVLVKDTDGPGPFHSKPIGEHSTVPTAAAVANAVYDAIGVQITELPITAEKVWAAIHGQVIGRVPGGHTLRSRADEIARGQLWELAERYDYRKHRTNAIL